MSDLPPSAFHRSAPFDPRRRRGPVYATFGLVLAVGASGVIGYTAGYAADDTEPAVMTVRPVVACRAVPPAAVPAEVEAPARPEAVAGVPARPGARPAVVVGARAHRERARVRRPARPSAVRVAPPVAVPVKAPVRAPVKDQVKAQVQATVRAPVRAPVGASVRVPVRKPVREALRELDVARVPGRSPLEALVQEMRGDLYAQVIDRITGRYRR
ncbi:hypothetical protein ABZ815_00835 [Nonomuraea sp. NPDC047529]|uniref:hypothetical protein n=1 Tax=Nonomuraea sp. NPDC047529 TaxID=3155623 RepID=UPI0033DE92DC